MENFHATYELKKSPSVASKEVSLNLVEHTFCYHPALDVSYLTDFHEDDWEQVLFSFDLFLNFTTKDIYRLFDLLKNSEYSEVAEIIHKVRPSFLLVGLSCFNKYFDNINEMVFQQENLTSATEFIQNWYEDFQEKVQLIQSEKERLCKFLDRLSAQRIAA